MSLHFYILLEAKLKKLNSKIGNEKIIVDFAMRYGNPSIKSKLNKLKDLGCENIIILTFISTICCSYNRNCM